MMGEVWLNEHPDLASFFSFFSCLIIFLLKYFLSFKLVGEETYAKPCVIRTVKAGQVTCHVSFAIGTEWRDRISEGDQHKIFKEASFEQDLKKHGQIFDRLICGVVKRLTRKSEGSEIIWHWEVP